MKMKKTMLITLIITLVFALALSLTGCDTGGGGKPEPVVDKEHSGTISAFGKTISVIGDASISAGNFGDAKDKLETAMNTSDDLINDSYVRALYITMLSRDGFKIIIETGNAGPAADANKSMTIGVRYLLDNDIEQTIVNAIYTKVSIDAAFVKAAARDTIRLAMALPDVKAFAEAGGRGVPDTEFAARCES
jgi:predicted small secreted protein